ncbi:MAG: glycosyl hydrolase [Saprospiraceae bacterium]|nr:glycosyl hydrolase [Saprospiraceae bacterium]MDZ4703375.1 glycosyl hydrolase [Saprospiraceae bacterium]
MRKTLTLALLVLLVAVSPALAQKKKTEASAKPGTPKKEEKKDPFNSGTFSGLSFRSIGSAVTSGRISDFAVNPDNTAEYYVASASGGVWKTTNHGTTFSPIFDGQGSYSIGVVKLDPSNPGTVWVGTGENNNQRSVAYGDGVYRSDDGGKSWKNTGLKNSEHISGILVDPTNSNTIWVGAYGPVWKEGGERGVYKSTDGGATWTCVKSVSDYTGCNDLIMDPRNPNVLYAAFHQRMRKVFTYIGGGPESAVYKTTDGGATWKKLEGGLPGGDVGRIAIGISPVNPDVLFAVAEAPDGKGGIYRSADRGASWQKQSGFFTSGNYYQEVTCDPKNVNRIFITDTYYQVSDDGGKTVRNLGELNKHIDNHCIWIDPANTDHLLVGCDGGIYETWDFAKSWDFKSNLPVTQFYKVSTDNASPFYHVHGGTQDNFSLAGPSRTNSGNGIVNSDWYVTSTGDGFETQVDQSNPDLIYAQAQYGYLSRFDRKSGEALDIKPTEGEGEAAYRWNWDAPLLISQHSNTRLYFGANKLFRTDDRGNSWKVISPDLTRQIDRNKLEVMGKVWSVDAISKNGSTDIYGQLTTIAESKLNPDLLWVGTDDGLIQVSNNGGQSWTKIDNIPGAPAQSYVHQIIASLHDQNVAYACFNHHRYGDFKPYLFKTSDGGKTWKAIQTNLPERGSIYTIAEDHVDANLLFVGTEFGAFFSNDGGGNWLQLKAGLPTIAVRDLEIQRRENDLVLGTFGRGFYILDDYTPLRNLQKTDLEKEAILFPVKDAQMFVEAFPLGVRDKGHLGSNYFSVPNPKIGAVFSYYLKEDIQTIKDKRREAEKAKAAKGEKVYYPSIDSLRLEDNQPDPYLLFTVTDAAGNVVRHLKTAAKKGLQRIVWDFRYGTPAPAHQRYVPPADQLFGGAELGYMVMPGRYSVTLHKFEDGALSQVAGPVSFECKPLNLGVLPPADKKDYDEFCRKVADLRRAVSGANDIRNNMNSRIGHIKTAIQDMPAPAAEFTKRAYDLERQLNTVGIKLNGDATLSRREFETPPSINGRVGQVEGAIFGGTAAPTETHRESYRIASKEFGPVLNDLKTIFADLQKLEEDLEMKDAPYTPGRWPKW